MIVGYSLSPGGLLFPWHIGALAGLSHQGFLTDSNPIAGSSAGSIAVASHAASVPPEEAVEATIRMSDSCRDNYGGARGNLLPLLQQELNGMLDDDVHEVFNNREGFVGLAYKELFPLNRPILDTHFDSKEHVIDSVCNSSMFPFFSTNWPCRMSRRRRVDDTAVFLPRIAVDGYFTVDRDRFGCPDLDMDHARKGGRNGEEEEEENERGEGQLVESSNTKITSSNNADRTVTLSVFPHDAIRLTASEEHDQISPEYNEENKSEQLGTLFRLATECATREEYYKLYEDGWKDAERWIKEEERRGYWGASTETRRSMYADAVRNKDLN